jgi:hypothetical protein
MNVNIGDIVFSGQYKPSFYPRAVSFFTKSKWSHCFLIMTDVANERTVLEADLKCQIVPFAKEYIEKEKDYYQVFSLPHATLEEKINAANKTYREFAGEQYGFMQIPWFTWDSLCNLIGWGSGKNWFPEGAICSEILAYYVTNINEHYSGIFKELNDLNRVSPAMIRKIVDANPDSFTFIGERK